MLGLSLQAEAQTEIWAGTLSSANLGSPHGNGCRDVTPAVACSVQLTDDDFEYDSVAYSFTKIAFTSTRLDVEWDPDLAGTVEDLTLTVAGVAFPFDEADHKSDGRRYWDGLQGVSHTASSYAMTLTRSGTTASNDATGKPGITGTAQVGQELTATEGTIADADGTMKADNDEAGYAYTYQWVRVDGMSDTDITGETSKTYTLTTADEGKKVKVKVSFTDDADNVEGPLVSDAFPAGATTIVAAGVLPPDPNTLVSNDGETARPGGAQISSGTGAYLQAQQFTTGDNAKGYTLSTVKLHVSGYAAGETVQVSVYSDNGGGRPDSSLYTLTSPTLSATEQFYTFDAPVDARLASETKYHVVVEATSGTLSVGLTNSDSEDADSASGWEIADDRSKDTGTGTWATDASAMRVVVAGLAVPDSEVTIAADTASVLFRESFDGDGDGVADGDAVFTLTRAGDTAAELTVSVALTQTRMFLPADKLAQEVTFEADSATATLTIARNEFPGFARGETVAGGTLSAAVQDGDGYYPGAGAGAEVAVHIVAMAGFEFGAYSVAEEAGNLLLKLVVRTSVGAPKPSFDMRFSVSSDPLGSGRGRDHARSPADYGAVSDVVSVPSETFELVGGRYRAVATVNFPIVDDDLEEDDEQYVAVIDMFPGQATSTVNFVTADDRICLAGKCATPITILDNDRVDSVDIEALSVTSSPASGAYYATGETITVVAEVEAPVDVVITGGTPTLELRIRHERRQAAYTAISADGTLLTFSYTVAGDDSDDDGIAISEGAIALNGGAIYAKGTEEVLRLTHRGLAEQSRHKVNKDPEIVSGGVVVVSEPVTATDTYGAGETIRFAVAFDTPVVVDTTGGTPRLKMRLGSTGSVRDEYLAYAAGSGTEVLIFEYTVQPADTDANGIFLDSDVLGRNGGTIRHATTGRNALLDHPRPGANGNFSGHKVDGSQSATVASLTTLILQEYAPMGTTPALALSPAFAATTTAYTATVGNDVSVVNVVAASTDVNVTFDIDPDDANTTALLHQVNLKVSANTITVTAAKSGFVSRVYTLVVTRERAAGNAAPEFAGERATRIVPEMAGDSVVATEIGIGAPVAATDADADTLTYSLEGTDEDSFTIDSSNGLIMTKAGRSYDYESKADYAVTVKADDGNGGTATIDVTIEVADAIEVPLAPAAPDVDATSGSTTSLDVSWSAPENAGRPSIDSYDVRYRETSAGAWTDGPQDQTGASASIPDLSAGTAYQVQVRATNADGDGSRSTWGTGSTNASDNNAATGAPSISGVAQVGSTLTASQGTIADADGLTAAMFAYQWVQVKHGRETDIAGATGTQYTLTMYDHGSAIKLRATFSDDGGAEESRTSAPTATVTAAMPVQCTADTVQLVGGEFPYEGEVQYCHGNEWRNVCDHGWEKADADVACRMADYTGAQSNGATKGSLFSNASIAKIWLDDVQCLGGETLLAECTHAGWGVHNCSTDELAGVQCEPPPNSPATGAPTISGTARVGETLTASTAGVADANGTTKAQNGESGHAWTWQWARVDDGNETDIPDATSDSYTLVEADAGRTVKVKVGFADDLGYDEGPLVSEAYPSAGTVAEADGAMGRPAITGMTIVGQTLSATADGISDPNGTTKAQNGEPGYAWTWQWVRVDGGNKTDIPGATSETYTLVAEDEGKRVKVKVEFTDDADNAEGPLTSAAYPSIGTILPFGSERQVLARVRFAGAGTESVQEGSGGRFHVFLDQALGWPLTVPLTVTHSGGATAADYTVEPLSVTIAAGERDAVFEVDVLPDDEDDDGESVEIGFGELPDTIGVGSTPGFTVDLRDDDGPSLWEVWFDATSYSAVEGGVSARVTVGLSAPWKPWRGETLEVPLVATGEGGAQSGDWSGVPPSVTFATGRTEASFTVTAVNDAEDDDGESVRLEWGELPEDLEGRDGLSAATVALLDDDGVPAVAVGFEASSYKAVEGGDAATVRVRLDAAPGRPVTVPLTREEIGATSADYAGVPSSVTFGATETEVSFTVTAVDDAEDDDYESVGLGFGALPAGVTAGEASTATVALDDDDGGRRALQVYFDAHYSVLRSLHEGGAGGLFRVSLKRAPGAPVTVPLAVTHLDGATAADYEGLPSSVTFGPNERYPPVSLKAREDTDDDDGEGLRIEFGVLPGGMTVNAWGPYATYEIVDNDDAPPGASGASGASDTSDTETPDPDPEEPVLVMPALSVADAEATEAPGASLRFAVTLDQASSEPVTVDWTKLSGTAKAQIDYVWDTGTLRFAPGETAHGVSIIVLNDAHDEGEEVLTLALSNASGARIADRFGAGTIRNADAMPQAWLGRFGRTVADQVLDAVEGRMAAPRVPGMDLSLAGQRIGAGTTTEEELERREAQARIEALTDWLRGAADDDERGALESREVTSRELLTGSSFALTGGAAEVGFGALWGQGVISRFDGREGDLRLDGEVTSGMLGADWSFGGGTAGLALSHSRGAGGYRSEAGDGEVEAALTGLYPYGRHALSERLSVWGVAGYGAGTLTLTPEGVAPIETDLGLAMAALGGRGVVVQPPADGGLELAAKTDALVVRTTSEAVRGGAGNLAASKAEVTRLRLGLEGTWRGLGMGSGTLVPTLEIGMRHDGGDTESGLGVDIGAGLAWTDRERGIAAQVHARGLLAHADGSLRERGLAGSLAWHPDPDTGRGPSLSVRQTVGAPATGGMDALLGPETAWSLGAANDDEDELRRRTLEATLGYGLPLFEGRYTGTPELGLGLSEIGREYSIRWRLAQARRSGIVFGLDVEGSRHESMVGDTRPEYRLALGFGWHLGKARRENFDFEVRFEALRLDAADDERAPEHRTGLRMTARW